MFLAELLENLIYRIGIRYVRHWLRGPSTVKWALAVISSWWEKYAKLATSNVGSIASVGGGGAFG